MTDATPAVDLQDPLPESNWFWRRVFVFVVTTAVLWMVWGAIDRLGTVAALRPEIGVKALLSLCKWLLAMVALMATYYMIAPSAEQVVKMMKTATLLRSGVQIAGRQATDGKRSEIVKTVGRPAPPAPGPVAPIQASPSPDSGPAGEGPPWAGQKENK